MKYAGTEACLGLCP